MTLSCAYPSKQIGGIKMRIRTSLTGVRGIVASLFAISLSTSGCAIVFGGNLEPYDISPSFSPDDSRVVHVCYRQESVKTDKIIDPYMGPYDGIEGYILQEICVSTLYETVRYKITDNYVRDFDPAWSPNGETIVFVSNDSEGDKSHLYTIESDGSQLRRLTSDDDFYNNPQWFPDGSAIAFLQGNVCGEIYQLNIMNREVKKLTSIGCIFSFDISPDGTQIVVSGESDSDEAEIFIVNLYLDSIERVTNNDFGEYSPMWAPDGGSILYLSDQENVTSLYIMNINTMEKKLVESHSVPVLGASWSPDGRQIAYLGGSGTDKVLYLFNTATGETRQLQDFKAQNTPIWSPNSRFLVNEQYQDWNEDGFKEAKLFVFDVVDMKEWSISLP